MQCDPQKQSLRQSLGRGIHPPLAQGPGVRGSTWRSMNQREGVVGACALVHRLHTSVPGIAAWIVELRRRKLMTWSRMIPLCMISVSPTHLVDFIYFLKTSLSGQSMAMLRPPPLNRSRSIPYAPAQGAESWRRMCLECIPGSAACQRTAFQSRRAEHPAGEKTQPAGCASAPWRHA